jgi:hypothetical protein
MYLTTSTTSLCCRSFRNSYQPHRTSITSSQPCCFLPCRHGITIHPNTAGSCSRSWICSTPWTHQHSSTQIPSEGHLDMIRQGVRSTPVQHLHSSEQEETTTDLHPTEPTLSSPTNGIITKLINLPSRTQQNHPNLTGRFSVASHTNNSYCMVMLSCDANYIHVEAMQSRDSADYVNVC